MVFMGGDFVMKKQKSHWLRNLVIALFVIAGMYLVSVALFNDHFHFRTYVNDMPVAFMTADDVRSMYRSSTKDLAVRLSCRGDYIETVPFAKFGICRTDDDDISTFSQNPWKWPLSLFNETHFEVSNDLVWTEEGIRNGFEDLMCTDELYTKYPSDAYILSNDDYDYYIVPEVEGNRVNQDKLVDVICDHLSRRDLFVDLEAEDCYYHPSIFANDPVLVSTCQKANAVTNLQLRVDIGCGYIASVPKSLLFDCVSRSGNSISVRYDPLRHFVKNLADTYNTVNTARRFQTTMDGKIRIAPSSTDNFGGWDMNIEATLKELNSMVRNRESGTVVATWRTTGKSHDVDNDFGDTYIEISIQRQRMWLYVDGVIRVNTDITTGRDTDDRRTPTGMFRTLDFKEDFTMTGEGYTAKCKYFIQVTADGVGIHDASWRSNYGGDEWVERGSHGCINTPFDAARTIFEIITARSSQGIPVIIY